MTLIVTALYHLISDYKVMVKTQYMGGI